MTFSSIIKKNFTHNFNKYISFYFVNSLIIAMLFMYGSLIYNPTIVGEIGESSLYETVNMALLGVILFSVVFITYTNIAFLKNRGKEFGMYLTLGMTTKDLTKLIFLENLGVMVASLATGIVTGTLFGRLFYMGLNKLLSESKIVYELNYKSFLLSIGIFVLIFIGNFIFNIIYIRRVSIIDVIKSSNKKEVGKSHVVLGAISLVLLIISMYCLEKVLLQEMFKEQSYMIGVFVALLLVCPYMVIGSLIGVIKAILSKFPKVYNNNLLVLSNLSHRFLGYKNLLYMLSLLVAGAMFFVGYSYALYNSTREYVKMSNPYDIMFVETVEYNKTSKEEIENVVLNSNSNLDKYDVLEYVEISLFKEDGEQLTFWSDDEFIVSETNFNNHMKTNIDVEDDGARYVTVHSEKLDYQYPNAFLTNLNEEDLEKVREVSSQNNYRLSKEDFNNIKGDKLSIELKSEKIIEEKGVPFANERYNSEYHLGRALVVDDKVYEEIINARGIDSVKKVHLLNIKNAGKAFNDIVSHLRTLNGLDKSYWEKGNLWGRTSDDERGEAEAYRPVYSEELIKMQLDENGVMLFTMMFIGLLFVIANGVVLYYKVLSDIRDEKERIESLNRIGILEKEIKSLISKELWITFCMPIIIGGGLGLYFLYVMVSNSGMTEMLMKKSLLVLLIGAVIQFVFYIISRKKYIREVIR